MTLSSYRPELCEEILDMFADGSSIVQVCARKLKIHRDTYYEWKNAHPEFKKASEQAEAISQSYWEDIGKDGITGEIEKFAGSSWSFVMKNRFREHYSDQQKEKEGNTAVEMLLNLLVEKNK